MPRYENVGATTHAIGWIRIQLTPNTSEVVDIEIGVFRFITLKTGPDTFKEWRAAPFLCSMKTGARRI